MRDDQAQRKKNTNEDYRKMLPEKVTGKDYRKRLQGEDYSESKAVIVNFMIIG